MLDPKSKITWFGAEPIIGPPIAGLSIPLIVPKITTAAAIVAPLDPMEIMASAMPVFTKLVATKIEDLGFCLKAKAGDS